MIIAPLVHETGSEWHDLERTEVMLVCKHVMDAWCAAHKLSPLSVVSFDHRNPGDGARFVGYRWTVTVGRGELVAADPIEAGDWTFSARVGHWWRFLNIIRGRGWADLVNMVDPAEPTQRHLASVTPIRADTDFLAGFPPKFD